MPGPMKIEEITLAGFRAYLTEQSISLLEGQKPRSLAVFAPNATGKSSLIDGLEFFFSEEGTLARLGQRRSALQAGREALAHVKAEEKGVEPSVAVKFRGQNGQLYDRRLVSGPSYERPDAANWIVENRKLDFIIRGSKLRSFVETQQPGERYEEVSNWFGLSALLEIQRNLRSLRLSINQILEADAATKERLRDLGTATDCEFDNWVENDILKWVNDNYVAPLDPHIALNAFDKTSKEYKLIEKKKKEEEEKTGLAQLKQVLASLKKCCDLDGETGKENGAIPDLEQAAATFETAKQKENDERNKSANSVFKDIWESAEKLLENAELDLEDCPVCETAFESSAKGSKRAVSIHLKAQLGTLAAYREAKADLDAARSDLIRKAGLASTAISSLVTALEAAEYADEVKEIQVYATSFEEWQEGEKLPIASNAKTEIAELMESVAAAKVKKEEQQGDHTWGKTLEKIDELITIREKLDEIEATRAELQKLHDSLQSQETSIAGRMRGYCQGVIDQLRDRVNEIFRAVHPKEEQAPDIRLELDPEGRIPELKLLSNFAPNREGVVPSGYFSDAQVHTLALSLRLAALQMFNANVPIIVMDDVVTSYDADHRRAIAGMLADQFTDYQIIIVTHDERFFHYLQEQLPSNRWLFKRITKLEPDFGPKFHGHNVSDQVIEKFHKDNESAATEMRQAEEEWLQQICRDFGVDIRIREVHRAFNYERAELARALMAFLKPRNLEPPKVKGVANRFLSTLQSGQIENFGSHFQNNPQGFGSVGDEVTRWAEFKEFRSAFRCPSCNGKRFKRPKELSNPVCRKKTCEAPFAFPTHIDSSAN